MIRIGTQFYGLLAEGTLGVMDHGVAEGILGAIGLAVSDRNAESKVTASQHSAGGVWIDEDIEGEDAAAMRARCAATLAGMLSPVSEASSSS